MNTKSTYVPAREITRVLGQINDPIGRASLFAQMCRINTLHMIATAGSGHIGTSFSSLDIVSWIYLTELARTKGTEPTIYYSSKGHDAPALYAVLAGLGHLEFDLIHQLRRIGGLPGHPDTATPGIWTNTGSLGMGISKAKGFAKSARLRGNVREIIVMTGDGELQEGQLWESLASAARDGYAEITLVVDHNKLQSDTFVTSILSLGDLEAKFNAFGWSSLRCDGHDFASLFNAFAQARAADTPTAIIADTVKGKGVTFMEPTNLSEDSLYAYHSGAPSPNDRENALGELLQNLQALSRQYNLPVPSTESAALGQPTRSPAAKYLENLPEAYGQALCKRASANRQIVALDADLHVDTGLLPFKTEFSDRFIECGIAEQDMVSQAGALALEGHLPFVHSFACFLSARPNEQIYNNASERTKIVYVGSLAGILPAGPGHSHQAVRDIASLRGVPDLTMVQPCCVEELERAVQWIDGGESKSVYLRLTSGNRERSFEFPTSQPFELGKGTLIKDGSDAVIFAYGSTLLEQAYRAATELDTRGIRVKLINLPWLNRIDRDWLAATVDDAQLVVTIDDHYVDGGQGEMIAANLAHVAPRRILHFGIESLPACGTDGEVLAHHMLDSNSIAARLHDAFGS